MKGIKYTWDHNVWAREWQSRDLNDNGDRFVNFCSDNDLVIDGTIFQHKTIHKLAWISRD